jgi:hypothetical protein
MKQIIRIWREDAVAGQLYLAKPVSVEGHSGVELVPVKVVEHSGYSEIEEDLE